MNSNENYDNIDRKYLIKENRKLRMELRESKEVCQMHKNALIILSDPHISKNAVLKTLVSLIKNNSEQRQYESMRKESAEMESKVMVLQKIVEQAINSQKETYNLLVNNFQELKADNMKKDDQLNKFYQKIGQVDYLSGLVTKYIEVLPPTEQTMAFQKQQSQLLDMLNLQKDQIRKLSEEKDKLIKINVHMKEELDKKKDDLRNLTMIIDNNGTMILEELEHEQQTALSANRSLINYNVNHSLMNNSLNQPHNHSVISTLNFLKLQNELIKEENEADYDSENENIDCPELALLFPDKIRTLQSTRERKKVPYLNMLKVRELMVKRENKLKKEIEAANAHVNPTTKIIKLQSELDITRKELSNYMLKYRELEEEHKNIVNFTQELQARNTTLMDSNERLSHIYKTLFEEYQSCRAVTAQVEYLTGKNFRGETLHNIHSLFNQYLNPIFRKNLKQQQDNNKNNKNTISTILLTLATDTPRKRALSLELKAI